MSWIDPSPRQTDHRAPVYRNDRALLLRVCGSGDTFLPMIIGAQSLVFKQTAKGIRCTGEGT